MTVSPGDPIIFETAAIDGTDIARLDDTTAIVVYDLDSNGALQAKVISSDGSSGPPFVLDAGGGVFGPNGARVTALSATKAMVVYRDDNISPNGVARILNISGDVITGPGAILTISSVAGVNFMDVVALSSSSAVAVMDDGAAADARAVYLTVSGNTITLESAVDFDVGETPASNSLAFVSSTKAVNFYRRVSGNAKVAVVLSVTGVVISAGTPVVIDSNAGAVADGEGAAEISGSQVLVAWSDSVDDKVEGMVLDISGTDITTNTPFDIEPDNVGLTSVASFNATKFLVASDDDVVPDGQMRQVTITGTAAVSEGKVQFEAGDPVGISSATFTETLAVVSYMDNDDSDKGKVTIVVRNEITLASMTKPADINADGDQIYIAALNAGGEPILIKIASVLNADGTIVFDPKAGDNIGVQCGRFDANVVWVAGAFDGTNVVEKSEDAGSSFTVKDTGAFGDVEAFVVGPDSDERVLISDVTNDDIQETNDDGDNWTQRNSGVGFNINAIARLDRNVQESVFGNDAAANDVIDYSVNSGDDMEDFTTGDFPIADDVTSVIVN